MPMLAEHFAVMDTNHDGKLTREEMKAARQKRR
jgi:Ca2+-binding EF-hand superfamily protein